MLADLTANFNISHFDDDRQIHLQIECHESKETPKFLRNDCVVESHGNRGSTNAPTPDMLDRGKFRTNWWPLKSKAIISDGKKNTQSAVRRVLQCMMHLLVVRRRMSLAVALRHCDNLRLDTEAPRCRRMQNTASTAGEHYFKN